MAVRCRPASRGTHTMPSGPTLSAVSCAVALVWSHASWVDCLADSTLSCARPDTWCVAQPARQQPVVSITKANEEAALHCFTCMQQQCRRRQVSLLESTESQAFVSCPTGYVCFVIVIGATATTHLPSLVSGLVPQLSTVVGRLVARLSRSLTHLYSH